MSCAAIRLTQNLHELRNREGEGYERWRSALLRSLTQS